MLILRLVQIKVSQCLMFNFIDNLLITSLSQCIRQYKSVADEGAANSNLSNVVDVLYCIICTVAQIERISAGSAVMSL